MDPRLLDLVWEVYRDLGGNEPLQLVSGFRSRQTNSFLRSRSAGVAKESQHTRGKAMDFFVPASRYRAFASAACCASAAGLVSIQRQVRLSCIWMSAMCAPGRV